MNAAQRDAELMLRVIDVCIRTRILPARNSPCHERLKSIIVRLKSSKGRRR